jgi:hypothetical protein
MHLNMYKIQLLCSNISMDLVKCTCYVVQLTLTIVETATNKYIC